jgi:hypothetical protein
MVRTLDDDVRCARVGTGRADPNAAEREFFSADLSRLPLLG